MGASRFDRAKVKRQICVDAVADFIKSNGLRDVVLAGHDHDYERFAPQTPSGAADADKGIREFVVGTGGRSHSFFLRIDKNSEARAPGTFGVMFLTLHARGYDWQFQPIAGYRFSDRGTSLCHGRPK